MRQLVVIAGAGPGIGAGVAKRFASEYDVVLLSRSLASCKNAAEAVQLLGAKPYSFAVDVSSYDEVSSVFGKINDIGQVAVGVYNVGGQFQRKPFLTTTSSEYVSNFSANV